jgi:outer membrane protein
MKALLNLCHLFMQFNNKMKKIVITIIALSVVIPLQAQYSLDSCKKMALVSNARVKNARLDVEAAEQTKKAAFTKYFPNVSATGSAFKSNKSFIDLDLNDVDLNVTFEDQRLNDIIQTLWSNYGNYLPDATINAQMMDDGIVGGVTAIQPVFAGGRIVKGNQLAKLGIEASQYKCNIAEDEVLLNTEESYWLIISLKEKLKTVASAEKLLDTLNKDVSGAYESGIIIQNDLLKVKLKQNELRSNRLKLENGIALATMKLCQYIGVTYDEQIQLSDSIDFDNDIPGPLQYKAAHIEAVKNRDEYKLLDLSVEAERLKKQMLVGETLPQVGVGAGYLYNNLMEKNNTNGVVFATVSVPLSGGWKESHNIKKQKIQQQIAENTRENTNELLLLQMQRAWNGVEEAYSQILIAKESMNEANQNLKVASDYYHSGMNTISEVLEAQSLIQQVRNQYTDQCIEYRIKLTSYLQMVKK